MQQEQQGAAAAVSAAAAETRRDPRQGPSEDAKEKAERGAVLDALLAAISATDTDEGDGGEGTLRSFGSLDEWRAFVKRLESGQALASCVIDFPFADATAGASTCAATTGCSSACTASATPRWMCPRAAGGEQRGGGRGGS
jgi:hypothetical protein